MADTLTRFSFSGTPVRGALVQVEKTWQDVASRDTYPESVRQLLGENVAAAALLTSQIKLRGSLALQIQSTGPLRLLYAQCTSQGAVRGLARYDNTIPQPYSLDDLPSDTTLAITIDQKGSQRYQGIVPLLGPQLSNAYEAYFAQSEQIQTSLWLTASDHCAAGLMLQKMPGEPNSQPYWDHIGHLAATITDEELLRVNHPKLLHRLFHQEAVEVTESRQLRFECPCSRERVARVLLSLGRDEALASRTNSGKVEVQCEFCNETYNFDVVDIEALFAQGPVFDAGNTRQ